MLGLTCHVDAVEAKHVPRLDMCSSARTTVRRLWACEVSRSVDLPTKVLCLAEPSRAFRGSMQFGWVQALTKKAAGSTEEQARDANAVLAEFRLCRG